MANARVRRGRKSQEILADWFKDRGWPHVKAREASLRGTDLYGMPGLAPEVKATAGQDFLAALRQATANADGDLPFVIYRPNGYGPERIGEWVVAFTLHDATDLLQLAGFNDGQTKR